MMVMMKIKQNLEMMWGGASVESTLNVHASVFYKELKSYYQDQGTCVLCKTRLGKEQNATISIYLAIPIVDTVITY